MSVVYFAVSDEGTVKIGHTVNVEVRMRELALHTGPLRLIGTIPGGRALERAVHAAANEYRIHFRARGPREWYDASFLSSDIWRRIQAEVEAFKAEDRTFRRVRQSASP